ncbi:7-cyano-7-deazaguanine/7-aminomethyl-7-deazaguanine transporter [Thiolinea disciformis]|uniref:7-cyano-7-deazaguanine/7-aminomethyl-7- deazaguanine transporter n=1 Tax=Thiolinea disciformis TaxID=125614 RepID=UPI00037AD33B|nr:7-cyano-7-deazaguanine/7-aminomethyl-7-deazaguanine transporter [Thiolinea disciformis]
MTFLTTQNTSMKRIMLILVSFHLAVIALSNYLVQIPIEIFGVTTTWGAITFPFIFLATDLTVRLFGSDLARRIILVAMLPALVTSYLLSVLFDGGQFQGFMALSEFNIHFGRIALASFLAYLCGQLLDIAVFNRLRQLPTWWIAPASSTIIGGLLDTIIFFGLAFYRSTDPIMAAHWPGIAATDYAFKIFISLILFVPAYGLLMSVLVKHLQTQTN